MIQGINHITLAVADLDRSIAFYRELLGLKLEASWPGGAHLSVGGAWICLSVDARVQQRSHEDYTHIAFSIAPDRLDDLAAALSSVSIWKSNRSEGDSIYFLDPDGHKLEAHVGTLETRLRHLDSAPYEGYTRHSRRDPLSED